MQQPELEEEALRLVVRGKDLTVERPDHGRHGGAGHAHLRVRRDPYTDLDVGEPGVWRSTVTANELGLWRATDGKLTALINVGPANPREFAEVTSTTDVLGSIAKRQRRRRAPHRRRLGLARHAAHPRGALERQPTRATTGSG